MESDTRRNIEWECAHLVARFYRYLDERDYDSAADLFVIDGEWLRMGELLQGRSQILDVMQQRPSTLNIRHILTNTTVDVHDDRSATVFAYVTLYIHNSADPCPDPVPLEEPTAIWSLKILCVEADDSWRMKSHTGGRVMVNKGVAPLP